MFGFFTTVFPENSLCKTCLQAVRVCRLIRQHVDKQPGVFHSAASMANTSGSVCEQWAGPGLHMLFKHVDSECRGPGNTELWTIPPSLPPPTRTHTNTCMHRLLHRHVLLFIRVRQRCLTLINAKRNPKILDIND